MLLQVIEPAQPINPAMNAIANFRNGSYDQVQYAFSFGVDAIDHACFTEHAGVVGLSAAGGIKGGAVEFDRDLSVIALADADDDGVELKEARIVVVESFGRTHNVILDSLPTKFKASTAFADYTHEESEQSADRSAALTARTEANIIARLIRLAFFTN